MAYVLGGYFLVQGVDFPDPQPGSRLPGVLWSMSDCVSHVYPGPWAADEALDTEERAELMAALDVDAAGWTTVLERIDGMVQQGALLWPHVFVEADAARRFASDALTNLAELQLLSAALPEDLVPGFLEEVGGGEEGFGVLECLAKSAELGREAEDGDVLGWEVLGWDLGGFHSHLCNDLEGAYSSELGIRLNAHGLIADEAEARRAAEFTNSDAAGAEPCPWRPWRIVRHALGD